MWETQAATLADLRTRFTSSADPVLAATDLSGGDSPVDAALAKRVAGLRGEAEAVAASADSRLDSEVQRMRTTASNYRDVEDAAEEDIQQFLATWESDW